MIVDTALRIGLEGPVSPQPVAEECPVCFALVLKAHLTEHQQAAHGKAAE